MQNINRRKLVMSKFVEGSYSTVEEANNAVEKLISQGYDRSDITMVTNQSTNDALSNDVHSKVYNKDANDENDESMMDKIKDAFTGGSDDSSNTTTSSENSVLKDYQNDIDKGNVVVLIEDDPNVNTTKATETSNMFNPPIGNPVAPNTVNQPIVDPINPGSDTVVDSTDDNSVEPAPDPTDDAGIDPTDPSHNSNETTNTTNTNNVQNSTTSDKEKIQLQEEKVDVDTNEVQTGEVHVQKNVTEETKNIEVPVKHEEITIEKKSVTDGEPVQGTLDDDNEEVTIPVTEEQIEVTKKPVVTDEVTINKETKEDTKQVSETVRKEDLDVDTSGDVDVEDTDNDGFDKRRP